MRTPLILAVPGLIIISLLIAACNKVQKEYNLVDGQPWISSGTYNIGPAGSLPTYTYPSTVNVGDTMSLYGKMFIGHGGIIKVGSVTPTLVYQYSFPDSVDLVRFIVTKEMGLGSHIPVSVTVGSVTVEAQSITINQITGVLSQTDTTLMVSQIGSWTLPSNLSNFQSLGWPVIAGCSISGNGSSYFDNPLGVFRLAQGSVQSVISIGTQLKDSTGTFTVTRVFGSCISNDGNTLAFTVSVDDNTDTLSNYVFRFCTMNLQQNTVTTLNRTLEPIAPVAQDGNPGAFTGPVAHINMIPTSIKTDINGNWYFINSYCVPTVSAGPLIPVWYQALVDDHSAETSTELDNLCRLGPDGKVSSLFSVLNGYDPKTFPAPGFPVADVVWTSISTDGSTAFIHTQMDPNWGNYNVVDYDLNLQIPLSAPGPSANYRVISYDTSTITGLGAPYINTTYLTYLYPNVGSNSNVYLALSGAYVLTNQGTASMLALNVLNQTAYIYAGTEAALFGGTPAAAQDQTTGKAKYVNFNYNGNYYLFTYFNGIDNQGNIYFYTTPAGFGSYGNASQFSPINFYKLYKP